MAIDPEIEEVLGALIDTVEERVGEVKTLLEEAVARIEDLEARAGQANSGGGGAEITAINTRLGQIDKQLQTITTQQGQINGFLTGVLKLMMTKKLITQQEMVEVYKSSKS